jgi:AcrR family transcriptional regulator
VSRSSPRKNGPRESDLEDEILDAVDRLLARLGYRNMTMEDLAQEVGIDKSPIYLSFRTKEDLLLSHIDRIVRQVVEAMDAISEGDAAPEKQLQEMLVARVMLRFDSVQHYSESLDEIVRDLRFPLLERRTEYFQSEARPLTKVIKAGQKLNHFRAVEPLVAVAALLEATNSLLPFNLTGRELGMRLEVRRRVFDITDLLIHGMLATPVSKKRK